MIFMAFPSALPEAQVDRWPGRWESSMGTKRAGSMDRHPGGKGADAGADAWWMLVDAVVWNQFFDWQKGCVFSCEVIFDGVVIDKLEDI